MRVACYPGSFDPITNGHLDIIKRSLKLFDKIVVIVANNADKKSFFTAEERKKMIEEALKDTPNVFVTITDGLVVDKAKEFNSKILIRGLRAVPDFEYEYQVASVNEYIDPEIEMVFLISRRDHAFISSSRIKELYFQNTNITPLVPASVIEGFKQKRK